MGIPDGFLIIYFIIALSFLFGRLKDFSCHIQTIGDNNMLVKHGLNILCVFFVIVIFTRMKPLHPMFLIAATIVMYMFFLLVIRCEYRFLAIFVACITVVFYIEAMKSFKIKDLQEPEKTKVKEKYETIQLVIQAVSFVTVVVGVVVYIGQHKREFGKKWSWTKFWLGIPNCSGNGSIKKDLVTDIKDGLKKIFNI